MLDFGEFQMTRKDGDHSLRSTPDAHQAKAVFRWRIRFDRAAHFSAKPLQHLIFSFRPRRTCGLNAPWPTQPPHEAFAGSLAICPAGVDCSATSDRAAQILVIGVDPRQVSVAAAEDSALEAELIERMSDYDRNLQ